MKIIKEGKIPEKKIPKCGIFYRGKCSKCGCEFEAREDEFIVKEDTVPKIVPAAFTHIKFEIVKRELVLCPTCGEEVIIKQTQEEEV